MIRIFENLQIRDIALHRSPIRGTDNFQSKTIVFNNTLDQSVEIRVIGLVSRDIALDIPIATFPVLANQVRYEVLDDYFPFLVFTARCSIAPTAGGLDAYLLSMREEV